MRDNSTDDRQQQHDEAMLLLLPHVAGNDSDAAILIDIDDDDMRDGDSGVVVMGPVSIPQRTTTSDEKSDFAAVAGPGSMVVAHAHDGDSAPDSQSAGLPRTRSSSRSRKSALRVSHPSHPRFQFLSL